MSQLVLSLTMGPQSLWAFSTTTEDVAIRNNLYQRLGPSETLRRLAARFPGGSAKAEVERRRHKVEDQSDADGEVVNVISEGTMKKLFFTLALVLLPASAWAGGCGSINAMISVAKSETIQAVNAYTTAEALLAAQNIIGTIKTESATIVRALVALKGQAVAGEAMKTEDMYGKAAQPAGLCGSSSLGAGRTGNPRGNA